MNSSVDLRELAIDRSGTNQPAVRIRRNVLTRYMLPLILIVGFLSLVAWASRDIVFPPKAVTVVPVFSSTVSVRQEGTPLFKAAGWIEPRPTPIRVAALAAGVVEKLLVVEDQAVKAGETIAELVKDDASLEYDRAMAVFQLREAELDEAKAAFTAAETRFAQPVHLEAALNEAEASLAKIETELKNLPFELRRAEADSKAMTRDHEGKVSAKGVIAAIKIDIAEGKATSAKALVEELRNRSASLRKEQAALSGRRDALKTQLKLLADETKAKDTAQAQVKAAKARVSEASVVVAEAKLQLDRMTIVAPVDGRVFRLVAHPGARIGSGMTQMAGHDGSTVVTMYRPSQLQIRVDTRFEDVPKVSFGQPVEVDNPALSSPLTGKVLFVSSEADIQKNTLQVKVEISDPPEVFKPEMLVDVTFLAPKRQETSAEPSQEVKLYVLQQLIQSGDGGSWVWLVDQSDGVVRKTTVQTGTVGTNGLVEITSGLNVSSRIVTRGSEGLQDGDRIIVTNEDDTLGTEMPAEHSRHSGTMNRLPTGDH